MQSALPVVECPICGNTDYDLMDGLYYCTLCQTQSQNVFEIDYSERFGDAVMLSGRLAINIKAKKKKEEKPKPPPAAAALPPNALYEAYAIIFECLGSALIQLGLPTDVKDALFRLYALFLRRRGIAFKQENDSMAASAQEFRSKFLTIRRDLAKKLKPARSEPNLDLEIENYYSANQEDRPEDIYLDVLGDPSASHHQAPNVSTPLIQDQQSEQTITRSEPPARKHVSTQDALTPASRKRKRKCSESGRTGLEEADGDSEERQRDEFTEHMNLTTRIQPTLILPFCYLACLAVAPQQVFMSDLLRWMKEDLLPVVNAYDLLPERLLHRKLQIHFGLYKWSHRSNVTSAIYRRTIWLANYVGYTPTINFDIDLILTRFAYELNLSKHFLPRARAIIRASKFVEHAFRFSPIEDEQLRKRMAPVTPPEVAAVAVLIVALRLTFGVDDHCEYVMSRLADKCDDPKNSARNFSFCRWQLQCRLRNAVAEDEPIASVVSRYWIDQRETWMHGLVNELQYSAETDPRKTLAIHLDKDPDDDDTDGDENEEEEKPGRDTTEVDIDKLRKLFTKFTPFRPSQGPPPLESRHLLFPMREAAVQLTSISGKATGSKSFDSNNVVIYGHNFFNDSLSFINDRRAKKRINQLIQDVAGKATREKMKLNAFEELFPCASLATRANRILEDYGDDHCFRVSNMMENETEYEISSNFGWLLKMCRIRLQENMWVLFRAVQRIEFSLDEELKAAKIYRDVPVNFLKYL